MAERREALVGTLVETLCQPSELAQNERSLHLSGKKNVVQPFVFKGVCRLVFRNVGIFQ